MIVIVLLCLDQSTKATGYSVWENKNLVAYGVLKSNPKESNPIERMKEQYDLIKHLISVTNPDFVVFENVQYQNNFGTFQQLSQLQGVIMSQLFEKDIGFTIVESTAWKSYCSVRGRKRAEQKASAIQMVKDKFNIEVSEDEADSIGIGIWAVNNISEKELDV